MFTRRFDELLLEKEGLEEEKERLEEEIEDLQSELPDCDEEEKGEKLSYIFEDKKRISKLNDEIEIIEDEMKGEV